MSRKRNYLLLGLSLLGVLLVMALLVRNSGQEPVRTHSLRLTSPAFEQAGVIPEKYTCTSSNESPPLIFNGIPPRTKSLAILLRDPDASGGDFSHWLIWNIPPITKLDSNQLPAGVVQGRNDFAKAAYSGPCPPSGTHHYTFELYALDDKLRISAAASKTEIQTEIDSHALDSANLTVQYTKPKVP